MEEHERAPADDALLPALMDQEGIEAEWATAEQLSRCGAALAMARAWFRGAVGPLPDAEADPRGASIILMAAGEYYDAARLSDDRLSKYAGQKATAALNRLAFDILAQLRAEYGGGGHAQG